MGSKGGNFGPISTDTVKKSEKVALLITFSIFCMQTRLEAKFSC